MLRAAPEGTHKPQPKRPPPTAAPSNSKTLRCGTPALNSATLEQELAERAIIAIKEKLASTEACLKAEKSKSTILGQRVRMLEEEVTKLLASKHLLSSPADPPHPAPFSVPPTSTTCPQAELLLSKLCGIGDQLPTLQDGVSSTLANTLSLVKTTPPPLAQGRLAPEPSSTPASPLGHENLFLSRQRAAGQQPSARQHRPPDLMSLRPSPFYLARSQISPAPKCQPPRMRRVLLGSPPRPRPRQTPHQHPAQQPGQHPAHQPGQPPSWQPPRRFVPVHQPVQHSVQQPAQHPAQQPPQHPAQQPPQFSAQHPTRESVIAKALIEALRSLPQDLLNF